MLEVIEASRVLSTPRPNFRSLGPGRRGGRYFTTQTNRAPRSRGPGFHQGAALRPHVATGEQRSAGRGPDPPPGGSRVHMLPGPRVRTPCSNPTPAEMRYIPIKYI